MKTMRVYSPFCNARESSFPLDMIVIHHIGSKNGKLYGISGTITWFTDEKSHINKETGKIENKVSAHYLLPREPYEDCDIIKCVDDNDVAYHAGDSQWSINGETRTNINNYSIGIELEGDGNLVEYTDYQYENLINLIKDLTSKYSIPEQNIVGHEEVAPGRKVDPGKLFDWKLLRKNLSSDSFPKTFCTEPPKTAPDDEFFMGGGDNTEESNNGLFGGFFTMFSPTFFKIFKR